MNNPPMRRKAIRIFMALAVSLAMLLSPVLSAVARQTADAPGESIQTVASGTRGPADAAEMEAFLDQLLAKQMQEQHIAGAAVSVVKDGKLFFSKGYGYADVGKSIPVGPEQTIYPIGSISKLFTWTAVMQLVEQRKQDLDADVNTYLDSRLPATYAQPSLSSTC